MLWQPNHNYCNCFHTLDAQKLFYYRGNYSEWQCVQMYVSLCGVYVEVIITLFGCMQWYGTCRWLQEDVQTEVQRDGEGIWEAGELDPFCLFWVPLCVCWVPLSVCWVPLCVCWVPLCVCWVPSELAPTRPLQEKLLRQMKSHGQSKKHAVSLIHLRPGMCSC